MKKPLFVALLLTLTSLLFAQTTDTITYPFDNATGFQLLGVQGEGGFISGTNSVTYEIGQRFDFGQGEVVGVFFWFPEKEVVGTPDSIDVKVYQADINDGLPTGAALASVRLSIADIDTTPGVQSFEDFQYIEFTTRPVATRSFIVAVEVNSATSDDTIGVATNADGNGMGLERAVMKTTNGQWLKMADVWVGGGGNPLDVDLAILPIVNEYFYSFATVDTPDVCPGDIIRLDANISGGSGNYDVSWSPVTPPNNIFSPFNEITDVGIVQTTTFTSTVIDLATNDTIISSVTVNVNAINVTVNDATLDCGLTTTLTAMPNGNLTLAHFNWSNGVQGLNNTVPQPGEYVVTATNGFGCQDTDTAMVTLNSTNQVVDFTFNTGQTGNIGCVGQPIQFTNTSSDTTNWNWLWEFNDGTGTMSLQQNPSYTFSSSGTYIVTLTADSGACGLTDSSQVIVTVCSSALHVNATVNNSQACPGDIRRLDANISGGSGNYLISWSPAGPPNNVFTPFNEITDVEITQTTTFTVTVIDSITNDTITSNVTITVNPINVTVNDATLGCGSIITLTAIPSGNLTQALFNWSNGAQGLSNTVTQPGEYVVTATNSFGCQDIDTAIVSTGISQVVDLTYNSGLPGNIVCVGESIQFINTSSDTINWDWLWEFNDGTGTASSLKDPVYSFNAPGTYQITLTADSGTCELMDSTAITVIICPPPTTGNMIYGNIDQSNGQPLSQAKVLLIQFNTTDSTLTAIDSVNTNLNGYYEFHTSDSSVFIKATPDSINYPTEMPTYYDSALVFQDASEVVLGGSDTIKIDFSTIYGPNPGGNGFIGGFISQGAGKRNNPASFTTLILMNNNLEPVGLTETDDDGYFEFDNLTPDTYKIWVDKPFINNTLAPEIKLTPSNPEKDSLQFVLHETWLENVAITSSNALLTDPMGINIYPNPTENFAVISYLLESTEVVKLEVLSLNGKRLSSITLKQDAGYHQMLIESDKLLHGLNLIRISTKHHVQIIKLIRF